MTFFWGEFAGAAGVTAIGWLAHVVLGQLHIADDRNEAR
jgi:hypothetical protein